MPQKKDPREEQISALREQVAAGEIAMEVFEREVGLLLIEQRWANPDIDRTGWCDGPWMREPDKIQWIDPKTDLDCLMVRNTFGAWCGYVGLPPGHPFYGKGYDAVHDLLALDVHGGLTYSRFCQEGHDDEAKGVCHVPAPGRPAKVWWLGFDCGHYMDFMPGMELALREVGSKYPRTFREVYRDADYVRAEVARLAVQLAHPVR